MENKHVPLKAITINARTEDNEKIYICNLYSIKFNDNFMFTNDSVFLKSLLEGTTTLSKLGLSVRTGNIVWNQHKSELTDDDNETVLIYNTNLTKEHTIDLKSFKNEEKHQYIKKDGTIY